MNSEILHGDCRTILPTLAAGSFDCVITDPPYGQSFASHGQLFKGAKKITGDESADVGQGFVDWCFANRVPCAVFCNPLLPWRGDWRQALVWDKGEGVGIGGDRKTCWKASWEMILVSRLFPGVFGTRDGAVLRFTVGPQNSKHHPAAKPVELMRYLIRKLVPRGGRVIDPFAGSGSTARAAELERVKCVGIESEEAYVELARRHLERERANRAETAFRHEF